MKYKHFFQPGAFLAIKGRIETPPRRSELEFVIHSIDMLQNLRETKANTIQIKLSTKALDQRLISDLNKLFLENPGRCDLRFTVFDPLDNVEVQMPSKSIKVDPSNELFKKLKSFDVEFEIR